MMKQFLSISLALSMGLFLSAGVVQDAEAKRLGGGLSFGGKPAQKQSAKRTSSAPNKAQQQNAAQKQAMSKKGGMMGLLGGLMIGGALGALFFGGAFENLNFMDILLFGGIAFLLYKLFTRRKQAAQPATANGAPYYEEPQNDEQNNAQQRQSFQDGNTQDVDNQDTEQVPENIIETSKIPRGFDTKSFLSGAENVYELLQSAWDKGELGDLRQFCTDEVFAELQDQIHANDDGNRTEIVSLKSELVNVIKGENSTEATVIFNAELREYDKNNTTPEITKAQEAWYFIRPDNRQEHSWLLDAVQQVED